MKHVYILTHCRTTYKLPNCSRNWWVCWSNNGNGRYWRWFPSDTFNDIFWNFDLIFLRPKPENKIPPRPPEPVNLEVEESYTLVESVGSLGVIYDQDTSNLAAQTRGFKSSLKRGQTLGNYQEVRIRHFQMKVNEYLSASK